jgi:hypothetical protein
MTGFNSLTERQRHFEQVLREAWQVDAGTSRVAIQRNGVIGKTVEVGR